MRRATPALATLALSLPVLLAGCGGGGGGGSDGGEIQSRPTVGDVLQFEWTGTKRVLFLVAEFEDKGHIFSGGEAEVRDVRDFVIEAFNRDSNGRTSVEIDYTWPPVKIPRNTSTYFGGTALVHTRADAIAAAKAAGYDVDAYDREVIFCDGDHWPSGARGWIRTAWQIDLACCHQIFGVLRDIKIFDNVCFKKTAELSCTTIDHRALQFACEEI